MTAFRSFWKPPPLARKVRKAIARKPQVSKERANMDAVRREDKYCRFPWCGCRKFKLTLHVAHLHHRGIGGNPKGDKSDPSKMILLCSARHRENAISLDRKTLRIRPLTDKGTRGPCAFDVDMRTYRGQGGESEWSEVARETALHDISAPGLDEQDVLLTLSAMER